MAIDNLAFRTAEKHVRNYERESAELMAAHREAIDCLDCEAFLQLGIDAFAWIMRADQALRVAAADGKIEYDDKLEDGLRALCRAWLKPCPCAQQWIEQQQQRGYNLDNLDPFRNCRDEMRAIVASFDATDDEKLPGKIAALRDQALSELANGETAEFV